MKRMKKTSGLLAFVIIFSMIASFVVMPVGVSAEEVNIAPEITAISHPTITQEGGVAASDDANPPKWSSTRPDNTGVVVYEMVEENGEKVVKVTQRQKWAGDLSGVWLTNAPLKSGKTYKVSVDLRADSFSPGLSRYGNITVKDIDGSKATIKGGKGITQTNGTVNMGGTNWTTYAGTLGNNVMLAASGTTTWDWVHYERTFTMGENPEGTAELGANIGFQIGESGNYSTYLYSFKNFKLVEIPDFTGSAVANNTGDGAAFTFSNNIATATPADFEVTATTPGADIPTLAVVSTGNAAEVTMSGYSYGTTYTITAKTNGITDEYEQYLAAPVSVSVTTEAAPLDSLVPTITGINNGVISQTKVVKASDAAAYPVWERKNGNVEASFADGVVSITARGGWDSQSGLILKNAALKSGKTYKISVDMRADAYANSATTVGRDAALYIKDIEGSKATIIGSTGIYTGEIVGSGAQFPGEIGDRVRVATANVTENWDWVHYEKVFTLGTNSSGTDELGVDIGFAVGEYNNSSKFLYSFKNFEIVEIPALTGSAVGTGTNGATFTFSSGLARDAEASDFEVSSTTAGAKTPELTVRTKGKKPCKTVVVTMSDYSYSTEYTITAKANVLTGENGMPLSAPVSVTVTTEPAPAFTGSAVATGTNSAIFAFSNKLERDAKASDFTVTTTTNGAKTPTLTVITSDKAVEVKMSGYTGGACYTIAAATNGLKDEFGQALSKGVSVTLTTEAAATTNTSGDVLFDLGLNKVSAGAFTKYGSDLSATSTMTVVKENDDKFVKVVDKDMEMRGGISCPDIPVTGKTTVSFDLRMITGSVNAYITGVGNNPICLVFGENISYFTTMDGGAVSTDAPTTIGKWMNITIVFDPVAKTFDLYKNGVIIAEDTPIREGAEFKDTFNIWLFSGDAKQPTEYDFKNIRAMKGEVLSLFDLALNDRPAGDLTDNATDVTETSKVTVVENNGDAFVKVLDKDMSVQGGINTGSLTFNKKTTITFDFRRTLSSALFYVSSTNGTHPISMTLGSTANYLTTHGSSESKSTGANLREGVWENITVVIDHTKNTFDFYKNGNLFVDDAPIRIGTSFKNNVLYVRVYAAYPTSPTEFDLKNFRVYDGEVVPGVTELFADRTLVNYAEAPGRFDEILANATVMSIGNSMARVNNSYVRIDADDEYITPFTTDNGTVMVPARFIADKIGCDLEVLSADSFRFTKDEKVVEVTVGNKTATVNGASSSMTAAPVIKRDKLFIPVRFIAKAYGKSIYSDDRGLVVVSDASISELSEQDIIKPLLNQIKQNTTLYGNTKYSDVNFSSRYYRKDGHMDGTTTPQWGTLDASKRFMATFDRWSYDNNPSTVKAVADQGLFVQGSLQPIFSDGSKKGSTIYYNGLPYLRFDAAWGNLWGCVTDPDLYEFLLAKGAEYIDMGMTSFQFDDFPINANYNYGGCFCDNCMRDFTAYLSSSEVSTIERIKAQVWNPSTYNYRDYIASILDDKYLNITTTVDSEIIAITREGYEKVKSTNKYIDELWVRFNSKRITEYHHRLVEGLEAYAGEEIFYSVNSAGIALSPKSSVFALPVDGVMGETSPGNAEPIGVFSSMYFSKAYGVDNIVSPYAGTDEATRQMYASIPMYYATGQFFLVPWDVWLKGSSRFYCNLEELEHNFEFPREYPWLFDNYEMPELIGYIYDMDKVSSISDITKVESSWATPAEIYGSSLPARAILHYADINKSVEANELKGLKAIVGGTDLSKLTSEEQAILANSGMTLISRSDTAAMNNLESTYWMTKDNNEDVYTILRTNQLYDDAPVVVHAVNYNDAVQENVEIDINNYYLPEGDILTVNVYKPGENSESLTVRRGSGSTKVTIDSINNWTILEICGPATVRREALFDLGTGINGIGLGTRLSKDKVTGTADDFTFITYSEGINSTTYGDDGSQDEAAFVYKHLGKNVADNTYASARFSDSGGAYGVMMREGVYSNARFAALVYDPDAGLRIAVRQEANEPVRYENIGSQKPAYMKLVKSEGEYVAYTSNDGVDYEKVGTASVVLNEITAGVFASSYDGEYSECRVRDFEVAVTPYELDIVKIDMGGIDFCNAAYINNSGVATVTLKLKNNTSDVITPFIVAASYSGTRPVSIQIINSETTIDATSSKTFELSLNVPDSVAEGSLEFFVFKDVNSVVPIMKKTVKAVNTSR